MDDSDQEHEQEHDQEQEMVSCVLRAPQEMPVDGHCVLSSDAAERRHENMDYRSYRPDRWAGVETECAIRSNADGRGSRL